MLGFRLFFIGIIVTALAGGGYYVMKLQKDNAILKANAIKLESAISEQKTLIENQKKDFEAILTANKELNDLMSKLKTDFAELDKRFNIFRLERFMFFLLNKLYFIYNTR